MVDKFVELSETELDKVIGGADKDSKTYTFMAGDCFVSHIWKFRVNKNYINVDGDTDIEVVTYKRSHGIYEIHNASDSRKAKLLDSFERLGTNLMVV